MQEFIIHVDDVLNFLDTYNGPKFHFALSDPPYEIGIIDNDWDKNGIAFSTDLYKGLYNVLYPGAFIAFYGYARTHHRVMVAMEDAGFILHKTMFAWVYTSGNPLGAANLQRNTDNYFASRFGGICKCETPVPGERMKAYLRDNLSASAIPVFFCRTCGKPIRNIISTIQWGATGGMKKLGGRGYGNNQQQILAESMTPEAELLKDYTYGLMWSKPMLEPIIFAQKPFENKPIEDIIQNGAGIVNVHNSRYINRWPGNFIAIHSAGCYNTDQGWVCADDCELNNIALQDKDFYKKIPTFAYDQTDDCLSTIDKMLYDSKPNQKERGAGLDEKQKHPSMKPISVNRYIGELFLPPEEFGPTRALCLFSGSGSEPIGLLHAGWNQVVGIEKDEIYATMSYDRMGYYCPKETTILIKDN